MVSFKYRIEKQFESLGKMLYRNPLKSLLIIFLLTAPLLYQVKNTSFDGSTQNLLRRNDSILRVFAEFSYEFGRSALVVAAIEPPEVFDTGFLTKLKALHEDFQENVPYIREVTSIVNARYTRVDGDTLRSEKVLRDWPDEPLDTAEAKKIVMNNPAFMNSIITEDGRMAAVVLEIQTFHKNKAKQEIVLDDFDDENFINQEETEKLFLLNENVIREMAEAIENVVKRHETPDFMIITSGNILLQDTYNQAVKDNMAKIVVLSAVTILFFLALLFRRVSGVILPVFVIELAVFATLGVMAINEIPVTDTTMIIPAFLLAVGIAGSVHVLSIFFRHLDMGDTKEASIVAALGHSGLAITLTSVTTAAGLLSFLTADLQALVDMGFYSAIGVMLTLFATLFILPPLLSIVPLKLRSKAKARSTVMDNFLLFFANFSTSYPKSIAVGALFLSIISIALVMQLRFSHHHLMFIPKTSTVKEDIQYLDKRLKGIDTLEVVVDTKRTDGIKEPDVLHKIEAAIEKVKQIENEEVSVGQVVSIIDVIKEIHRAFNEDKPEFYRIPDDRKVIAQELFLYETANESDALTRIVNSQFSKARITVKLPSADAIFYERFINQVQHIFEDTFKNDAEIICTGSIVVMARIIPAALQSMSNSYMIALVVITIIMILLVWNLKVGLISMVPNLLPIVMAMAVMVALGDSLNLVTVMIGSIAIGLVVDDTVHFVYNFQKYHEIHGDPVKAINLTFLGTGRALLITSIVLSLTFFVILTTNMQHMKMFGGYTGIVVVFALLADFIIAPALLYLIAKDKPVRA